MGRAPLPLGVVRVFDRPPVPQPSAPSRNHDHVAQDSMLLIQRLARTYSPDHLGNQFIDAICPLRPGISSYVDARQVRLTSASPTNDSDHGAFPRIATADQWPSAVSDTGFCVASISAFSSATRPLTGAPAFVRPGPGETCASPSAVSATNTSASDLAPPACDLLIRACACLDLHLRGHHCFGSTVSPH